MAMDKLNIHRITGTIITTTTTTTTIQRNLHQPILVISLPVLNNSINWKQFTKISDDLINTLPFQKAYKSSNIIISKQQPRSLGFCIFLLYFNCTFYTLCIFSPDESFYLTKLVAKLVNLIIIFNNYLNNRSQ